MVVGETSQDRSQPHRSDYHRHRGDISFLDKAYGFVKGIKQGHDIASKIQDVRDEWSKIEEVNNTE